MIRSIGQCGYCQEGKSDLGLCRLRCDAKSKWQEAMWICGSCRKYLSGLHFRYVKPSERKKK